MDSQRRLPRISGSFDVVSFLATSSQALTSWLIEPTPRSRAGWKVPGYEGWHPLARGKLLNALSHPPQHLAVPEKGLDQLRTQAKLAVLLRASVSIAPEGQTLQVARSKQERTREEQHVAPQDGLHLQFASGAEHKGFHKKLQGPTGRPWGE